jgi:PIN domain nuclease of toxin-antitoxin system
MRLLLDAHTLIWAVDQPSNLSTTAATTLQDPANERFLSAGTLWEIAIKVGLGKLTLSQPYRQWIEKAIADLGLAVLPLTIDHAEVLTVLPHHHRDPFDRLLVAQSQVESMPLVSTDSQLDAYGITRIW